MNSKNVFVICRLCLNTFCCCIVSSQREVVNLSEHCSSNLVLVHFSHIVNFSFLITLQFLSD